MDDNGKEQDLHLVQLDKTKTQQEYDKVYNKITQTSAINIVKIERVQNPELYRAYMVKKQKMDDKDGSNETSLFHGTAVDTCKLINHKGFNRSYCGRNGELAVLLIRKVNYFIRLALESCNEWKLIHAYSYILFSCTRICPQLQSDLCSDRHVILNSILQRGFLVVASNPLNCVNSTRDSTSVLVQSTMVYQYIINQ